VGVLAADEEAVGLQRQVDVAAVELAFAGVGVLVVVSVQADVIGDLPVVAGVVVDLLAGAVVIVLFPVVAILDVAGPRPGIQAAVWLSITSSCAAGSPRVCEMPLLR